MHQNTYKPEWNIVYFFFFYIQKEKRTKSLIFIVPKTLNKCLYCKRRVNYTSLILRKGLTRFVRPPFCVVLHPPPPQKTKKKTQNLHFKHFEKRPDRTIVKVYLWVTNKQQTSALITTRASALIEIRVRVNNNALVLCSQ